MLACSRGRLLGRSVARHCSGPSAVARRAVHVDASFLRGSPFVSLLDYTPDQLHAIFDLAAALKVRIGTNRDLYQPLAGRTMAMLFQKRSTRTRVSAEAGFEQLGGHALFLGADDVQLGVNESLRDTAYVLSRMNDLILARVFSHDDITTLAATASVPVINALSDLNHPLQGLADYLTLREHFGALRGLTLAWVGDGNNILHSLMAAGPRLGVNLRIACPPGYFPDATLTAVALRDASHAGTTIDMTSDPAVAAQGADVLATDTFVSMGQEAEAERRLKDFAGFQVTHELAAAASPDWVFMHCLPRKPYEVTDDVFYSTRSLVFDEAENRKWTIMAVMLAQLQGGMVQ